MLLGLYQSLTLALLLDRCGLKNVKEQNKIQIMKIRILLLICIILGISGIVKAQKLPDYQSDNYQVQNSKEISKKFFNTDEEILFVLDFSNSMTEEINGEKKVDLMLNTMKELLPKIDRRMKVGLRVYGQRIGLTQIDACRASTLAVPIIEGSSNLIKEKLEKTNPRGMTPITYSLKKAVNGDFGDYTGKKHIILLTDGGENCDESPCNWALEFIKVRHDVKIDVIAFNISDKDDLSQLKCTALVTSGKFHTANTAAELAKSLNNAVSGNKKVEAKIIVND